MPARPTIMSPAGLLLLTLSRPVGTPALAIPRNTLSTNRGCSGVPNLALKIWIQCGPHWGVAASAGRVPTVQTPLTMVNIAAAASIFFLMDMNRSLLELQWRRPVVNAFLRFNVLVRDTARWTVRRVKPAGFAPPGAGAAVAEGSALSGGGWLPGPGVEGRAIVPVVTPT